jgi:hypothetical protein
MSKKIVRILGVILVLVGIAGMFMGWGSLVNYGSIVVGVVLLVVGFMGKKKMDAPAAPMNPPTAGGSMGGGM